MQVDSTGTIEEQVRRIVRGLRNELTFKDNMQVKIINVPDTGLADTSFTVIHNLGKIPIGYISTISLSGFVYDFNRAGWTTTSMTLKCSAVHAVLNLIVF